MINNKKIFLGGPIQYAINREGHFDLGIENNLKFLIKRIKDRGHMVFSAHEAEEFGAITAEFGVHDVSKRDFNWMKLCDIYVALLPIDEMNKNVRSDGTYVEIGWASAMNKPIILIIDSSVEEELSMLVRGLDAIGNVQIVDLNQIMMDPGELVELIETTTEQIKFIAKENECLNSEVV